MLLQNEEGKPEPLVSKIKDQYLNERQVYLQNLHAHLGNM